jgi:hypothetical protein
MVGRPYRQVTPQLLRNALFAGAAIAASILMLPMSQALAQCAQSGLTVTCSGTTTNAVDGFGNGTQSGLTINVQPGASVTGTTDDGLNLNDANTINNSGAITGANNGIATQGSVTVNNSSTGQISASGSNGTGIAAVNTVNLFNYGTVSGGLNGAGIAATTANVINYGSIFAPGTGGLGIDVTTANVTNFGVISGNEVGINTNIANITNYGTISAPGVGVFTPLKTGIRLDNGTVTNFGTISGDGSNGTGIAVSTSATIINSGTISAIGASGTGIIANGAIIAVNNSGSISANATSGIGIFARSGGTANITNSGTISAAIGIFTDGSGPALTLTNSGTIIGTNAQAIDFHQSSADTLNFLPGSRIIGDILLGTSDAINIRSGRDIAWLLTFGCSCGGFGLTTTASTAAVTGGAPFAINGNQIATLDPTAFGLADHTLVDFTGDVSSLISSRFGEFASTGSSGTGASAFAPRSIADAANAAFGGIPAVANAYAQDTGVPNATTVDKASGIAVWSKGFAGVRHQDADGPMLAANTVAYGGVIGMDKQMTSDLRLGAFIGAGNSQLNVDLSSQTVKTDYAFGGIYGRYDWSLQFVDFAISIGHLSNASNRLVANNLAPSGLETATANYGGWFVSPELAYGYRIPLASNIVLTPIARVRYVAAVFEGYSETGSAQNLTVATRTTQNVEERFGLALSRTDPAQQGSLKTTATLGVLGQERFGSTTFNTVLIGQNLAFAAPGQNDVTGIYTGVGFDYRTTERVTLFAAVEGTIMSDKSKTGIVQSGVRVSF